MAEEQKVRVEEQELLLPEAVVTRVMKKAIDPSGKISKEAARLMQEALSELIGFVTSEAAEAVLTQNRKTISNQDVLEALHCLGFNVYADVLEDWAPPKKSKKEGGLS